VHFRLFVSLSSEAVGALTDLGRLARRQTESHLSGPSGESGVFREHCP
jgi:hypothetical protein